MSQTNWLKQVEVFSSFNDSELSILENSCSTKEYEFGDTILSTGDKPEDIYVILSGKVRVFVVEEKERSLGICREGDSFAEKAIISSAPVDFSVRASGKTEILCFPISVIRTLLEANKNAKKFITQYAALKFSGGLLAHFLNIKENSLDREEYDSVIRSIGAKRVKPGSKILEQDNGADCRLYILRSGTVSVIRNDGNEQYRITQLEAGEIFGEQACLNYSVQPADVVAESDCLVLIIPQETVHKIINQNSALKQILEERIDFFNRSVERQQKVAKWKGEKSLFSSDTKTGRGGRIIKRFQLVEQAEEMDCGAACLAMICKHYKIGMSLGKLREMANVTTEGATMESLAHVGETLHFQTKGVRASYGSLKGFDLPFIAHWEGFHYVIVYGISKSHIWLADPGAGFRKLTRTEFEKGWTGNCLLFSPTAATRETRATETPWSRFFGYIKPMKTIMRDLLLAALIMQLLGLASPIILQNILDRVIVHQNVHLLNMMIMGLVSAMLFSQLTEYVSAYLSNFMARKMDFAMISHFYQHVLSLPVDFFSRRKTGDIVARFQENETVRSFMTESSIGTILNTIMVSIYMIVLFKYSASLTFVLLAFLIPIILLTLAATPKYKDYARKSFYAEAEAESLLMESLSGAESIKAMAVERNMRIKWEQKYTSSLDIKFRTEMFTSAINGLSELLKGAATIAILWFGAHMVLKNEFTIGQMIAYNGIVGAVMTPLLGLVGVWDELQETLVSMERLGDVLDLEEEQHGVSASSRIILPDLDGNIEMKNIYFRYGGDSNTEYILENISLTIPEGSTVAIVGSSGSGKTTLAKLLVGLYKPTEGSISICDCDIGSLDLSYYRRHIGYVMQNNLLFAGTISENIAMGVRNIDQRQVVKCAKLADAHGFISNLPLGYEQVIGERGVGLSGGQNQRLCIARALYNDPKLLIFDEATSALDGESEYQIQTNLSTILKDRTAVVIAHRLSTVIEADRIFVLYKGKLAEQGSHEELVNRQGMYYQLFKNQLQGIDTAS